MTGMLRFDPFRDFDRLAGEVLSGQRTPRPMPMDVYRHGEHYVVELDCPGIDADSLDLTAENNTLTVSATRRSRAPEGTKFLIAERSSGSFNRQLVLGDGLDLDAVDASYRDGVLTVTIPIAAQAKPRRISIGRGEDDGHQVITGESRERQLAGSSA
ncbi:18 kDa antigen [Pilimelia terevasa]|uniref:18 kDa antigen n=1 Tax=Pilimelia terevasa TaxID=53372 RepID=A0A8J3BRF8_9ACTN|nr:Hsp20/alpha crystallin family protein [Pilimelia terevasa]GGK33426.1 18 kDa antigen [Pilimelia terevasa]